MGRPKRSNSSTLATIVWYAAVEESAGKYSSYALERHFDTRSESTERWSTSARPCQWSKYRIGKHFPNAQTRQMVEDVCPGTQRYLFLDLWKMLEVRPDVDDIERVVARCRPKLLKYVTDRTQKPRMLISPRVYDSLAIQGDLDALTTLIALMRHAEIVQCETQYLEAAHSAFCASITVLMFSPFRSVAQPIFRHLWDNYLFHTNVISPGLIRDDVDIAKCIDAMDMTILYAKESKLFKGNQREVGRLNYALRELGLSESGESLLPLLSEEQRGEKLKEVALFVTREKRFPSRSTNLYLINLLRNSGETSNLKQLVTPTS